MEHVLGYVALAAGLSIGMGAIGACTGIALWYTTANPFIK